MFRKMPFILLAVIALSFLANFIFSMPVKSFFYSVSLLIKEMIIFTLPALIFGLLLKTSVQLAKQASKTVIFLLVAVCLSNFISTLLSYSVGHFTYGLDLSMSLPSESESLAPMYTIALPKIISNAKAMFLGLLSGIALSWIRPAYSEKVAKWLEKSISIFLKALLSMIPLFIFGFMLKMNHDKTMVHILQNYVLIFLLVAGAVFTYISFIYFAANRFLLNPFLRSVKNMLPAGLVGFGSMSSAAALPLSIIGAEKNARNPDLARSFVPATVNIHLIGDCFAIPIFAFAVLKNFGMVEPSFYSYLTFAAYFVLAKFSIAAVPGGGILVMLPVLESTLGFSAPMLSLITALYILFDPVITSANTLGNGGFVMVLDRLFSRKKKPAKIST